MSATSLNIPVAKSRDVVASVRSRRSSNASPVESFASRLAHSRGETRRESANPADEARSPSDAEVRTRPLADASIDATATSGEADLGTPESGQIAERGRSDDAAETLPSSPPTDPATPSMGDVGKPTSELTGEMSPPLPADDMTSATVGSVGDDHSPPLLSGPGFATQEPQRPLPTTAASESDDGSAEQGLNVMQKAMSPSPVSVTPVAAAVAGDTGPQTEPMMPRPDGAPRRSSTPTDETTGLFAVQPETDRPDVDGDVAASASKKGGEELAEVAGKVMSRVPVQSGSDHVSPSSPVAAATTVSPPSPGGASSVHAAAQQTAAMPREDDAVARQNIDRIVNGVRGELLPRGGSMQIRLDPPQLGSLNVTVRVHDGVLSASFQTSSEQATQMLSQTMTQLKSVLEASGVSVERLHVQQAPASRSSDDSRGSGGDGRSHAASDQQSWAQGEQQRREMLQRMWRRLGLGSDPLDLVA